MTVPKRTLALCLLVLALIAGACGGDDDTDTSAGGDATTDGGEGESADGDGTAGENITIFHRWTDTHQAAIEQVLEECDGDLPNISLDISNVSSAEYEVQLPITLSSNSPPDIYALWPGGRPIFQSENGLIAPITSAYNDQIAPLYADGIDEGVVETDGEIYVMPFNVLPNAFYYRTDKFEQYGLTPPETWDEFVEVLSVLKENGETPIALGSSLGWEPLFWFDYLILRVAGPEFREDLMWGNESFTDPLVVEAMEMWVELLEAGYFNDNIAGIGFDEMTPMVADGTATMMLMGPWAIDGFEQAGLTPGTDFDMFPFPTIDPSIPDATEGAMEGWAATGFRDNDAAVAEVLACIASTDKQTTYASNFPSLTPNPDVAIENYPESQRPILERLQGLTSASFHQNLELATIPPVTEVAKREIPRLLTFPDDFMQVLEALESTAQDEFGG